MTTSSTQSSSDAIIAALNAQYSSLGKTSATDDPNSASSIQNNFLTMLTAQLQNQDPLNPMDNSQVTSQMAQLSTLQGIQQMNTTMQTLSDNITASQSMSATSMIGHGVLVPGDTLSLSSGAAIGGIVLTAPADNVNVTIKDQAGNTVATVDLGSQKAGVLPFVWDGTTDAGGTAADGTYTYTVATSMKSGDKTDPGTTLSYGSVNAVTPGASGVSLDVGSLGTFALSDVKQVM